MHRPTVSVYNHQKPAEIVGEVRLPPVFRAPIRNDIVQFVHSNLSRNTRQAHGVDPQAGMKHSAESWGTGRAVARVPRVGGSGTSRSGQAAFANFARKGRMAFPLHTWRRWHRKVNLRQRRHALASALAATAVPPLVLARGHRIMNIPQLPLVVDTSANKISKTKEAVALLKNLGAFDDVERVINARRVKAGRGKVRGGRYKHRCGPLVVVADDMATLGRALRNVPGVSVINVNRLNIRHLAPGAQVGRFCIFTEDAFRALGHLYGSFKQSGAKKGFLLHREVLSNADISQLINSDAVQKALRPKKPAARRQPGQKKNPLRNKKAMDKLNPYAAVLRKMNQEKRVKRIVKEERPVSARRAAARAARATVLAKVDARIVADRQEYKQLFAESNIK